MTAAEPLRFTLRDGSPVEIRRVEPTDKDRLRAAGIPVARHALITSRAQAEAFAAE